MSGYRDCSQRTLFKNVCDRHNGDISVAICDRVHGRGRADMANKGSFLRPGEFLSTQTGDYLVSANGSHFAAIQGDGNFCIYRGSGPGDNVHGPALWCSMRLAAAPCFAAMQGDGNPVSRDGILAGLESF